MMSNIFNFAIGLVLRRVLREEIRIRSLKAVRLYVAAVGKARIGALAAVGGIAAIALLIAGAVLFIGGLLSVLGVSGRGLAWTALVFGLLVVTFGIAALVATFNERRWLQMSRSYDLMDAVIEPVPNLATVPKNFVRALKGEPTVHATRDTIAPKMTPVPRTPPEPRSRSLRPQEA